MASTFILEAELFTVVLFALIGFVVRTVDGKGFLACILVGVSIMCGGGLSWFVVVAAFFALGVAVTFYKYGYKRDLGVAQEKGGTRSWPSMLANGGVASIVALLNLLKANFAFSLFFLGSISTAAADTVATELGLLSRREPRLITNPTVKVMAGTSGGITSLGVMGSFFAAIVIGTMALLLGIGSVQPPTLVACVVGGLAGALFDSLLGATVQRKGYCSICMKPTEALNHCGEWSHHTGGSKLIENNLVNLIATGVGAAAAFTVYLIFTA